MTFTIDVTDLERAKALACIRRCDLSTVLREAVAEYLREGDA